MPLGVQKSVDLCLGHGATGLRGDLREDVVGGVRWGVLAGDGICVVDGVGKALLPIAIFLFVVVVWEEEQTAWVGLRE